MNYGPPYNADYGGNLKGEVNISAPAININFCEAEIILCLTRYSRATSLKKISRN